MPTLNQLIRSVLLAAFVGRAFGQTFDSSSSGKDGALILNSPGIVVFDPQSSHPPLNPKGDGVYHFSSITIGAGVTVKLSGKNLRGPIFWLSQGPVQIDGTIDLNGEDGTELLAGSTRIATVPGAGGYSGGVRVQNGNTAHAGSGMGGGPVNQGGVFTGNELLIPLVGGSGGGGSNLANGGGGGGALLIASSTSITINGTISANGGNQTDRGYSVAGGSGGAIRLVAPLITGLGALLTAKGGVGSGGDYAGQNGRIRLEAYQNDLRGEVNGTPLSVGKPFKLFLPPDPPPSVEVVAIGNTSMLANSGSAELPKVMAVGPKSTVITLEAHNVTPGTVIRVHLYSDTGKDQTVESSKLVGTFQNSRAMVSAPLANGLTHIAIDANWKLPAQVAVH